MSRGLRGRDLRSGGIEIREAHFPGRAPIDAYGNGGFRFADMSHRGSLMCLPSGIYGWNAAEPADLTESAFDALFAETGDIEVCLIGSGLDLVPVRKALRERFRGAFIQADSMNTGAAVRTYNVMLAENRAVAAALLAV